jgi:hypothetical protein
MAPRKHQTVPCLITSIMILMSSVFVACLDDNFDRAMNIESLPLDVIVLHKNAPVFPVPGGEGVITNNLVTETSIQVLWFPATDVETAQADLEYRLYMSSGNNISTPADAENNGTTFQNWQPGLTTEIVTGLDPATTYFFNVVVRDGDGLTAAYRTVSITTQTDMVFLFPAGLFQGNIALPTTASVRHDIDDLCMQSRLDNYPDMHCLNVRAFISINSTDDIAGMPANFGLPTDRKIIGPTGITVVDYWADLLDGSLDMTLSDAGVSSDHWWSGSLSDGSYDSANNCSGWTSTGSNVLSSKGRSGKADKLDDSWIEGESPNCSATRMVLCTCW